MNPLPPVCPDCGSPLAAGRSALLCAVCALGGEAAAERVGDYELLGELTRGGMGIVYRARQAGLNRLVALKLLPGAPFGGEEFRARFRVEAEAAARLRHPGIVAVHEVGVHRGQPFFSMDLIEGGSLAERLQGGALPPHFAAQLLAEISRAVHYAHGQGVIHRDLKPSNILLDAENRAWLTDFGLARLTDSAAHLTLSGQTLGTPHYLPPERIEARAGAASPAEDVYGLGAVLYHALTGRPPFSADTPAAIFAEVRASEPVPPRRLNASLPRDLETICLRCLEKAPARRYASAAEVAEELARYLAGEPIRARPLGAAARVWRRAQRHPAIAALSLALACAVLGGSAAILASWQHARAARALAEKVAEQRRVDLYSANMQAASAAWENHDLSLVRRLLETGVPAPGSSDLRGFEWWLLREKARGGELATRAAHGHIVTALAWRPDGGALLSGAHDGSVKCWPVDAAGKPGEPAKWLPPGPGQARKIAWLPDGKTWLLAGRAGEIALRRAGGGAPLWTLRGEGFALAGETLAVSEGRGFSYEPRGAVRLWRWRGEQAPEPLRTVTDQGRAVAISPDARWLAAGLAHPDLPDAERGVALSDLTQPDAPPRLLATKTSVWALAFSPDSEQLAAAIGDGIFAWKTAGGDPRPARLGHTGNVWSVAFEPGGARLVSTGTDRTIRAWDGAAAEAAALRLRGHENEIWSSAFRPDGRVLASGDKDGNVKWWPWPPPEPRAGPRSFLYSAPVFSRDGAQLFVYAKAGADFEVRAWRTVDWAESKLLPEREAVRGLDFAGRRIVRPRTAAELVFYEGTRPGPVRRIALGASAEEMALQSSDHALSPDGNFFAHVAADGRARRWDLRSGEMRGPAALAAGERIGCGLSVDGRWLVAATWDALSIHDFTMEQTRRLPNDVRWIKCVAFSPDGTRAVTGGSDGLARLWHLPQWEIAGTLRGHLGSVDGIAFAPDGRGFATIEVGAGVRFWRVDTQREVARIDDPTADTTLVFSPDGQTLLYLAHPPGTEADEGRIEVVRAPR